MMPDNLNLLPQNLQVSKGLSSTLKTAKSLGVIFIVAFIIFCLGMAGYFVYSKITLDSIQANVNKLTAQVKAQESSEQQLILLKDRLGKIALVKNEANASKNIAGMNTFLNNTSPSLKVSEVNITPIKMTMSLNIYSNDDLTKLLQNIKSTTLFNQAELSSFNYGAAGYTIDLNLNQISNQ